MRLEVFQVRVDILDMVADAADGVLVTDRNLRIVLYNKAAETLLGFQAEEVLGSSCYDVLGARDSAGQLLCHGSCHVVVNSDTGKCIPTCDLVTRTKAGRELWLNMSTFVVRSPRRQLFAVIHVFRDVTQRKQIERFIEGLNVRSAQAPCIQEVEPPGATSVLTVREVEVLRLLASGITTKAIAEKLGISPLTARNHIRNLLAKLGVHTRLEAVLHAVSRGLLGSRAIREK